jgi:Ca2+-binding EF-hand superfamily protein
LKVIREWFDLVDDDGSGTLEHHELLAALQVRVILFAAPVSANTLSE